MINETLYAKYIKDREGLEILEDELSFIIYKISGEECFIRNMCIENNARGSGKCREIIDRLSEIAGKAKCKYVSANIDLKDPGHDHTLLASLHLGFRTVRANDDVLLIIKELGE